MTAVHIVRHDAYPMQAGPARQEAWVAEFEPVTAPEIDPLMGWTSSTDMMQQVRIPFATLAAAEVWCRGRGLDYTIHAPRRGPRQRRTYGDNFRPTAEAGSMPR